MKKGWKTLWIATGTLAVIGLILCLLGLGLGVSLEKLKEYGLYIGEDGIFFGRAYPDEKDEIDGDTVRRIRQTADLSETWFSGISELYVEVSHCEVEILPTEDTKICVDSSELEYGSSGVELVVEQTNDSLEIINYKNGRPWNGSTYQPGDYKSSYGCLSIYLPRDQYLSYVSLKLGACDTEIQGLYAGILEIDAGNGSCEALSVDVEELTADIGAGELEMDGTIRDKAYLYCGAGDIELRLENSYEDFDYDLQSDYGDIQIGSREFDSLHGNNYIGNGSSHLMEISCGAGSVDIEFVPSASSSSDGKNNTLSSTHHTEDSSTAATHHDEEHK